MRLLRSRTGITPNVLARYGFCLSLEEPGIPPNPFDSEEASRDINRHTLLGEHDTLYVALLRTWVARKDLLSECSDAKFDDLFTRHMNRGFELISARVRNLPDLALLVGKQTKN